ncbi:DNA starvation/stationary phase protection protein [Hymenobacter sp. RP-2-7]|uniref:DNA starvation/stationary phase protection protein n=1 Tax=Hymenobacter polaris TaxID=2682546 RepID=A0A7Y0ABR2_9BACT|nr:DNA starvation/stationary phase protection protein [Hymenobacter polaris]NML64145.1 DNA starvation/stationary phase protection protein [Hymenobacter polaris]
MKVTLLVAASALFACAATQQAQAQRRNGQNTAPAPAPISNTSTTPVNTDTPPPGESNGRLDYRNPAADDLVALDASKRQTVADDLEATVVELLELYHDTKQSHWNLRGPLYLSLHEQLQDNASLYLKYADILAERSLQIGRPIDGRTSVVTANANLGGYPGGYLSDKQVLILLDERINTVSKRVRERIAHLDNIDAVTSNQLQDLDYYLDKHVWKFRVMQQ